MTWICSAHRSCCETICLKQTPTHLADDAMDFRPNLPHTSMKNRCIKPCGRRYTEGTLSAKATVESPQSGATSRALKRSHLKASQYKPLSHMAKRSHLPEFNNATSSIFRARANNRAWKLCENIRNNPGGNIPLRTRQRFCDEQVGRQAVTVENGWVQTASRSWRGALPSMLRRHRCCQARGVNFVLGGEHRRRESRTTHAQREPPPKRQGHMMVSSIRCSRGHKKTTHSFATPTLVMLSDAGVDMRTYVLARSCWGTREHSTSEPTEQHERGGASACACPGRPPTVASGNKEMRLLPCACGSVRRHRMLSSAVHTDPRRRRNLWCAVRCRILVAFGCIACRALGLPRRSPRSLRPRSRRRHPSPPAPATTAPQRLGPRRRQHPRRHARSGRGR